MRKLGEFYLAAVGFSFRVKHFSPSRISICWVSSVHETGTILRTGGEAAIYVVLVGD